MAAPLCHKISHQRHKARICASTLSMFCDGLCAKGLHLAYSYELWSTLSSKCRKMIYSELNYPRCCIYVCQNMSHHQHKARVCASMLGMFCDCLVELLLAYSCELWSTLSSKAKDTKLGVIRGDLCVAKFPTTSTRSRLSTC